MRVLNVGGGTNRTLSARFEGWMQDVLDIDPAVNPDVLCDALQMRTLAPAIYDGVYCSHNLEHFYKHDVPTVLAGFLHVLKDDGIVEIAVPNMQGLFNEVIGRGHDIDDIWYRACGKPITFHDVMYGYSAEMEKGNLYYAHKCGFSPLSLGKALVDAGFRGVKVQDQGANILALGYKNAANH